MATEQARDERQGIIDDFKQAVNMTGSELEQWLKTDQSHKVGQKDDGGESIGHESGRRIVKLLGTSRSDYADDDLDHMRRVIRYVHRHLAQRPDGDVLETRWRYSLMNWGHDPLKE